MSAGLVALHTVHFDAARELTARAGLMPMRLGRRRAGVLFAAVATAGGDAGSIGVLLRPDGRRGLLRKGRRRSEPLLLIAGTGAGLPFGQRLDGAVELEQLHGLERFSDSRLLKDNGRLRNRLAGRLRNRPT